MTDQKIVAKSYERLRISNKKRDILGIRYHDNGNIVN